VHLKGDPGFVLGGYGGFQLGEDTCEVLDGEGEIQFSSLGFVISRSRPAYLFPLISSSLTQLSSQIVHFQPHSRRGPSWPSRYLSTT
jgi:hypothetical protein